MYNIYLKLYSNHKHSLSSYMLIYLNLSNYIYQVEQNLKMVMLYPQLIFNILHIFYSYFINNQSNNYHIYVQTYQCNSFLYPNIQNLQYNLYLLYYLNHQYSHMDIHNQNLLSYIYVSRIKNKHIKFCLMKDNLIDKVLIYPNYINLPMYRFNNFLQKKHINL